MERICGFDLIITSHLVLISVVLPVFVVVCLLRLLVKDLEDLKFLALSKSFQVCILFEAKHLIHVLVLLF